MPPLAVQFMAAAAMAPLQPSCDQATLAQLQVFTLLVAVHTQAAVYH
jgi:hypothetical protein